MSKTVDERVVSMQFDNANFERNVSTSMSTLDKLKRALKLDGVGKGFDNISKAAKNVDMNGLGTAVDTVRAKFSALDVVGVTALANITNSAINAGKNMVKALTLDPVMDGFREYETQINSVQTILANTQSKGTTLDQVNAALDELNKYADQTIYNFSEMTRNIGTFTAAGVDLDKSVTSIKGIANLAAASGSSAAQASTAMYQLSQAIAAGRVSLMDWNSVVNAGMGGELFQNALKRTAEHFGTNVDAMISKYGSFRESLTEGGWLTTEVLTETLTQLSGAYSEADLIAQGYTQSQAKEITEMAKTALDAATKVKTFTQLWDTMKEAVGSGWAQTWEIIIGDFGEAKELLTSISDFFTGDNGVITKMSNARNNLLEGALNNNPFSKLAERIEKVTAVTDKMTKATQNFGKIADKVIGGEFGDGQTRIEKLTKAGYDWAYVQNLVNQKLGDSTRHATDFKESQDNLNQTQATTIEQLLKMSDAQLKNLGFTQDEVEAFRDLQEQSEKTGIPVKDLLKDLDQLNGRTLLINSFKNAASGLITVFSSIGKAWRNVFPAMTSEQLYDIIAALHKFSTNLLVSGDTADKITRTFQGLFSLLHMVSTIFGGALKIGFTIGTKVLSAFGLTLLDVTAYIGDAITWLDKLIFNNELVNAAAELMASGILAAGEAFKKFLDYLSNLSIVKSAISGITDLVDKFREIGPDIIAGLKNGLVDGISSLPQLLVDLGQRLIEAICGVLGIHSPSTVFFEIGQNIIQGLLNGLKAGAESVYNFLKDIASKCAEFFSNVDWGSVISVAALGGILFVLNKFADGFNKLAAPLEGVGSVLSGTGSILESTAGVIEDSSKKIKKVLGSFSKVLKANAFKTQTEGIRNLAISIAILAASIYVLAQLDSGALWNAVGAIAALATILGVLAFAMEKMSSSAIDITRKGVSINALKPSLVGIGLAILALAAVVRILGTMDSDSAAKGFEGLIKVMLSMAGFLAAAAVITKFGPSVKGLGSTLLAMSVSLLVMAGVAKILSMMDKSTINKGVEGILKFVAVFAAMALVTRLADSQKKRLGTAFVGMAVSIAIMAGVAKLLASMDRATINKGIEGIYAFVGVFAAMAIITRLASAQKKRVGSALLGMSVSLLAMVGVVKLLSMMSPEDIDKGISAITKFVGIMAAMVLITRLGGNDIGSISGTLVSMSIAIGVMAAIAVALSFVKTENLAKGIVAVGMLGAILSMMIYSTRGATEVKGPLIAMTVAIGIMATAVALLSLIDTKKLAGSAAAMSAMMLAFGAMAKMSGGIKQVKMASFLPMLAVVGILAAVVAAMSLLDTKSALPNVLALSTLMMAFSASLSIISKAGTLGTSAIPGLAMMVGVTALLATILGVMSALNVEASIGNAIALSTLLLALSGAMTILDGVGRISGNSMAAMAVLALIVGEIGVVLGIMSAFNIEPSISTAISLSVLINALAVACGIVSMVPLAGAVSGALGLAAFIGVMAAVVTAAGALAQIPGLTWLIEEGGDLLQKVGEALGKMVGGLVGGVGVGLTASLPEMGSNLTAFMQNLQGFLEGAKTIDPSVVDSVSALAAAILVITAANFIDGITRFLGLGEGLSGFADSAKLLGDGLNSFAKSVADLDESSIEKIGLAAKAIQALAEAADTIPNSGGWLGAIVGENDIGDFASQLSSVGEGLTSFAQSVSGLDESAIAKVEAAGKILSSLAKVAQEIPNSGGWLGAIVGENDIDDFGTKLPALGKGLSEFASSVSGIDESATEKVSTAVKIVADLAKVAQEIPNSGGMLAAFVGDNDLSTFATDMTNMGDGLTAFAESVSKLPEDVSTKVAIAIDVIKQLADLVNSGVMEGEEGLFTKLGNFFGGGGDATGVFSQQMATLGEAMSNFSTKVGSVDPEAVNVATSAFRTIVTSIASIGTIDPEVVNSITSTIPTLGDSLSKFSTSVSSINVDGVTSSMSVLRDVVTTMRNMGNLDSDAVNSAISAIDQMTATINSMASINTSGVESFVEALEQLAAANVTGVVEAFRDGEDDLKAVGSDLISAVAEGIESNKTATDNSSKTILESVKTIFNNEKSNFNDIGTELMTQVKNGIESMTSSIESAIRSTVSSASSTLREYYSSFYNSGAYVAQGFANGISANSYLAAAKARAMANQAAAAAQAALDEHSPSKVFYKIGDFAGLAFVNALDEYGNKSYKSGAAMADYARKGLSRAIRSVGDMLENGVDTQPTIRPVLDLSDVQSGTGALRSMFANRDFTIGASANLSAINSMMRQNGQNGANDDIISAINKLRKELGNVGGTSYNINGITYDDGTNVAEAVRTLIRAAKIEGRA